MVRRRSCAVSNHETTPPTFETRRNAVPQEWGRTKSLDCDAMTSISIEAGSQANAPLEKIALETYVPPAKPSLVGLSRAEIAEQLGAIGVTPAQRKMRVQQLWHWIYVRGAKKIG